MATIDIRRAHTTPKQEARKMAEELVKGVQKKFDLDWHWEGDRCLFSASQGKAKGTSGSVDVGDREIHIQIDLPLLLRVFKGMLETRVHEGLAQLK